MINLSSLDLRRSERAFLDVLLSLDFAGAEALREQAINARKLSPTEASIVDFVEPVHFAFANVVHPLPVDANFLTANIYVQINLYVYFGRLSRLELIETPLNDRGLREPSFDEFDPYDFSYFLRKSLNTRVLARRGALAPNMQGATIE